MAGLRGGSEGSVGRGSYSFGYTDFTQWNYDLQIDLVATSA